MKKLFTFILLAAFTLSMTSCWEFRRQQHLLDEENNGKAILAEAEYSKRAMIEEAKAKNESATLEAEAQIKIAKAKAQSEIERAKGVAEANRIIGESLRGNDDYLQYLKIQAITEGDGDRVYIATEAMLPITEAGK